MKTMEMSAWGEVASDLKLRHVHQEVVQVENFKVYGNHHALQPEQATSTRCGGFPAHLAGPNAGQPYSGNHADPGCNQASKVQTREASTS